MSTEHTYLIWKEKWAPHGWYCPNSNGYTGDVTEAGRYSEAEAKSHEKASHRECIAVEYGSEEMVKILKRCDSMAYKVYLLVEFMNKLVEWWARPVPPPATGPKGPPTIPDRLPESLKEKIRRCT